MSEASERDKILKLATDIGELRGYTNDEIVKSPGVTWQATDGTPYVGQRLLLINEAHRELLVAGLLLLAGPDEEHKS